MKGVLLIIVLFVFTFVTFVSAENGCCGETYAGDSCVYTTSENCETENYFSAGAACENVNFCGTGCCVKSDGSCGEGAGYYSCELVEGSYSADQNCEDVFGCAKVCCQLDSDYNYITEAECDIKSAEIGIEAIRHSVSSESECYALERENDVGCCVTENGCVASSGADCGTLDFDVSTGYGFYTGESCADISSDLADDGLVAAENCNCEIAAEYYTCDRDNIRVLSGDSCENVGEVIEECSYPNEVCSMASGTAKCVMADCETTFAFPTGSVFENFNSYPVFYEDINGWNTKLLNLGEKRKNGESWCIYESPVGSFRDRVGSQHYLATCSAGEVTITNCVSDRSEICVAGYDNEDDYFSADCYANNFDSFYSVDDSEAYYGSIYPTNSPESSGDSLSGGLGVSTVSRTTSDYCDLADFSCDVIYGDEIEENDKGWELYVNAYCLRKAYTFTALDYCAARGNCGLKENLVGEEGEEDGFLISYIPSNFNDIEIGCGKGCFDQQTLSGDDTWADVAQCSDESAGSGCTKHSVSRVSSEYYDILNSLSEEGRVIQYNFMTEAVASYSTNDRADLLEKTGAQYSDCIAGEQIMRNLLYALGTDVHPKDWFSIVDSPNGAAGQDYLSPKSYCGEDSCLDDCKTNCNSKCGLDSCDGKRDCVNEQTCAESCYLKCDSACSDCIKPCKDYCGGLSTEECSKICDENVVDAPFVENGMFNAFRSLKPWYMSLTPRRPDTESSQTAIYDKSLLAYDGDYGGCDTSGGGNEWEDVWGEREWALRAAEVNYDCNKWVAPTNGDCSLCDKTIDEGGLIFSDGERVYQASYCNKFRCESLGSNCLFVGDNFGSDRPSCVEQACEPLGDFAYLGPHEQALEDSKLSYSSSNKAVGYSVDDIPVGETFSFGIETEHYAKCVFLDQENIDEFIATNGDTPVNNPAFVNSFSDENAFFDALAAFADQQTPLWGTTVSCDASDPGCTESYTNLHNFTYSIGESEGERMFYVWCKSACGAVKEDPYIINLKAGFDPPSTPPDISEVYPVSGSLVAYTQTNQDLSVFLNRASTCKYSSSSTDTYETMTGGSSCVLAGDDYYGYFPCDFNIALGDGTTTIYILCQDSYGNTQTESEQWYVSKSEALEITQAAPSGTLYTNDITLQVNTANGVENGKAVCSYAENGRSSGEMILTSGDYHEQPLTKEKGSYIIDVSCVDSIGNTAESQISFTVDKDVSASEIESVYYLGSTLYVITNEASTCQWDNEDFSYGGGSEMAGTAASAHTLAISNLTEQYVIVCIDAYGNEMNAFNVDFRYFI